MQKWSCRRAAWAENKAMRIVRIRAERLVANQSQGCYFLRWTLTRELKRLGQIWRRVLDCSVVTRAWLFADRRGPRDFKISSTSRNHGRYRYIAYRAPISVRCSECRKLGQQTIFWILSRDISVIFLCFLPSAQIYRILYLSLWCAMLLHCCIFREILSVFRFKNSWELALSRCLLWFHKRTAIITVISIIVLSLL